MGGERRPLFEPQERGRALKLKTIRIEKFRGIRNAEIDVATELALVGQNSGGKSSILRALNAFFNFEDERDHFEASRHAFQKTSTAIIELSFQIHLPSAICLVPWPVALESEFALNIGNLKSGK
jgi:predicted ATP-dependent endonuclease of OLD family